MFKRLMTATAVFVATLLPMSGAHAGELRLEQDKQGFYLGYYGSVEYRDSYKFMQMIQYTQGTVNRVKFSSPGGVASEGYKIGELMRTYQMISIVPEGAYCLSACGTAFAGGVDYQIDGYLGYHIAWTTATEMPALQAMMAGQRINAQSFNYYAKMDFSIDFMTIISLYTDPSKFFVFDDAEDYKMFVKSTAAGVLGPSGVEYDEEYFAEHLVDASVITSAAVNDRRMAIGAPVEEEDENEKGKLLEFFEDISDKIQGE